jgi:hypothetical protein
VARALARFLEVAPEAVGVDAVLAHERKVPPLLLVDVRLDLPLDLVHEPGEIVGWRIPHARQRRPHHTVRDLGLLREVVTAWQLTQHPTSSSISVWIAS